MHLKSILFALPVIAFTHSAQAEFFACHFTEPFISVYLSTSDAHRRATIDMFDTLAKSHGIVSVAEKNDRVFVQLDGDAKTKLQIRRTVPGSDGMSDFNYPFEAKMTQTGQSEIPFSEIYGGCENEVSNTSRKLVTERIRDLRGKSGGRLVNFWPGEQSFISGYRAVKTSTLPPMSTWDSLNLAVPSKLACTIRQGKELIPSVSTRGEIYAHYSLVDESAASNSAQQVNVGEEDRVIPLGKYVYTKCKEGHFTWVPMSVIEKHSGFEPATRSFAQ